jgi:ribonuclease P protein component
MTHENEKLGKVYKLCSVKTIDDLFKSGKKVYKFPFSGQIGIQNTMKSPPFQIVISVPKRNFKKAVDRNRLKRLIREAVRKNKLILESFLNKEKISLSFVLVYTHKEQMTFKEINEKTKVFFAQLIEELQHEK